MGHWMVGSFDELLVQFLSFLGTKYVDLKNEEETASRAMQVRSVVKDRSVNFYLCS